MGYLVAFLIIFDFLDGVVCGVCGAVVAGDGYLTYGLVVVEDEDVLGCVVYAVGDGDVLYWLALVIYFEVYAVWW